MSQHRTTPRTTPRPLPCSAFPVLRQVVRGHSGWPVRSRLLLHLRLSNAAGSGAEGDGITGRRALQKALHRPRNLPRSLRRTGPGSCRLTNIGASMPSPKASLASSRPRSSSVSPLEVCRTDRVGNAEMDRLVQQHSPSQRHRLHHAARGRGGILRKLERCRKSSLIIEPEAIRQTRISSACNNGS